MKKRTKPLSINEKTLSQVGDIIDNETSIFLREVSKNRKYAFGLFDFPQAIADEMDMKISDNVITRVKKLKSISKKLDVSKYITDDVINYFNKVTVDGRYIEDMAKDPEVAAKKLGLKVSKETISNIKKIGFDKLIKIERLQGDIGTKADWVVDAVIVIVIVTTLRVTDDIETKKHDRHVIDNSGLLKL